MKIKLIIGLMCLVVAVPLPAIAVSDIDSALQEADTHFTYSGKPIHPFLIERFSNWLSDNRPPIVTTVDVSASFDTNEYQQRTIEKRDDWWFSKRGESVLDYSSFGYRWLGKMADGTHVLEVGSSGGGSGFFMDLMFVRFSTGEILVENKREKELLLTVVGIYSLGDRYEGDIKVYPDKVVIPASKGQFGGGSLAKDTALTFPSSSKGKRGSP
jgi:hypothetical protein